MIKKYKIIDSTFNRANYPDLIGKIVENPPPYATVIEISEKKSMKEISDLGNASDRPMEMFVKRCWKEGYDKEEIISGIIEFYNQSMKDARFIFNQIILKLSGIKKNEDKD